MLFAKMHLSEKYFKTCDVRCDEKFVSSKTYK